MTTIISTDARVAHSNISQSSHDITASVANLVSGKREDANVADFSVGSILTSKVGVLRTAILNAGQAKSLLETAKGALKTISDLLNKQKNLAVKSSDDSLSNNERAFLNQEFQALTSEINRIATNTNFNGKGLIDGSISGTAGVSSTTDLPVENYSLLRANDTQASGTVSSGDLHNSHATVGETLITFGTDSGGPDAATITFRIDEDGSAGSVAEQTVTFDVVNSDDAAAMAAKFVAAVNTAVTGSTDSTYENFAQFDFIDNGDGTVTVRAKEAGTNLNNYYFSASNSTNDDAELTVTIGNSSATTIEDQGVARANQQKFTANTTAALVGDDGIFKVIAANNIADTAFTAAIDFADTSAGTGTVNGVKLTHTLAVGAVTNNQSFTFGTGAGQITITFKDIANLTGALDEVGIDGAITATEQAASVAAILNQHVVIGGDDAAQFNFTSSGTTVTATAKRFGFTATDAANNFDEALATLTATDSATGEDGTADAVQITIRNGSNSTVGGVVTWTIAANTTTAVYTDNDLAALFVAEWNQASDITTAKRLFSAVDNADGTVTFTAREAGTDINAYDINFNEQVDGNLSLTFGGDAVSDNVAVEFHDTSATLGTNKSIAPSDLTFDNRLLGGLTNLQGIFTLGVGNDGSTDDHNNTVKFTVEVNGITYTSQDIQLVGSSSTSTVSNTIAAGTKITFQSASGPVDGNGAYTNGGFQLTVEGDINLATVTNSSTGQDSLNSVVDDLQTQLDSISITQERSLSADEISPSSSDHRITAAVGTILEGLEGFDAIGTTSLSYGKGDIRLTSDLYSSTGTHGSISSFTVDRLTDTISTTINGEKFVAYLNSSSAPTLGGVQAFGTDNDGQTNNGTYNSTTKILDLGSSDGKTAKLNFYSESTEDGRILTVDLGHVSDNTSQINISTTEGEDALAAALDAVFSVSSNDSLSFQVGSSSDDVIGVSIGSAKATDLFVDDDGVQVTPDITTIGNAQAAGDVISRALNNVISLIATVDATISSFSSAITNNESSLQNSDAARSVLLDTDYSKESTRFAEARVRQDAAVSVLAQVNQRVQNLLQLLRG